MCIYDNNKENTMAETTQKRKTLTVKKVVDKAIDVAKDIANQQMQEQDLMQGKIPQETKAEPTPEPKAETPAQERRKEKDIGIEHGYKNGINVESVDSKIIISFPNRKDINYAFNEQATGMRNHVVGWTDSEPENKLFFKEKLQTKSVSYDKADLTPDTIVRLSNAIESARTINAECMAEKQAAIDYFKHVAGENNIVVLGTPFVMVPKFENGQPTDSKEPKPSYFNGDIVKAGKHLIGAIEGSKDQTTYVRLIETSKLPLTAHEYADRANATKNHLGIRTDKVATVEINGKEQEIIVDTKRHIAFNNDWNVSKVNEYAPKAEQAKPIQRKNVQTMAQ